MTTTNFLGNVGATTVMLKCGSALDEVRMHNSSTYLAPRNT
jgi:hypothetical protein